MRFFLLSFLCFGLVFTSSAQETYPVNGSHDIKPGLYAFINATIIPGADFVIQNGVLLVKDRKIEAIGPGITVPKGYIVVDLKGKYIYPGLIDAFTNYGLPALPAAAAGGRGGSGGAARPAVVKPGAYAWNQAIKPDFNARSIFTVDGTKAENLKKFGFGAVLSVNRDGIARGTSVAVSLGNEPDNLVILNGQAAAQYSFSKGTSSTSYPTSLMGTIALLRQTYMDAAWYKTVKTEYNISLDEFNKIQNLPQIFEVTDALNVLRADKIGDEFNKQYIFKTDGKEYQRIKEIKATGGSFIIPVSFPKPFEVEDPADARKVNYADMKDWELAPTNPGVMEKAGIRFAITSFGVDNPRDFWANIRTAINNGLSEKQALRSLTQIPAEMLGIAGQTGTLGQGKLANFIITSDSLFKANNIIYENWVEGRQYVVSKMDVKDLRGNYSLSIDGLPGLTLKIGGASATALDATVVRTGADSVSAKATFTRGGDIVGMYFDLRKNPAGSIRLSGLISSDSPVTMRGESELPDGTTGKWIAKFTEHFRENTNARQNAARPANKPGPVIYPFVAYGNAEVPKAETVLFKNATVWTNENEGILQNADVLVENGKIKAVGKGLAAGTAKVIDATGKHISPGIVDEHSHIAASNGINEGAQSVSSEVRVADVINSEDINIYRQLAGGVTTSQILHGSANSIGGQSQLIKLRWGKAPEELKFEGSDGFIKFALGENVKQSNSNNAGQGQNLRFPQTRMGVEQVFIDAFTRAKEYKAARAVKGNTVRQDLELDALVEILDGKRFITCHSYVQSEINMLIHVADSMGFKINTFTHILEGYKVADKMKAHNIAGSTFSDWWTYKMEVAEAIPYNGKLMHEVGVLTGFNSDDAEMARRLNQEAGKAVTYGGLSQEDALKLVTLNPAKMLHIDNRVGSLKAGKDADLVLWSANPLSIYAVVEKTYIEGVPYWDMEKDAIKRKELKTEEGRLIQKMIEAKASGAGTQRPAAGGQRGPRLYECESTEADMDQLIGGNIQ